MQEGNENGVTRSITLYKPCIEDLWFRKMLLADPETMSFEVPTTYGFTVEVGDSHLSPPLATQPQLEVSRFVSDSTRMNSGASHPIERY